MTKCGERSARRSRLEILELGPGRGFFARDVLDWSEKKFPEFFGALHYSLAERSAALRELEHDVERHLAQGKASLASFPSRSLTSAIPIIVFANEFFDALPVEIVSAKGELRIAEEDDRFLEIWVPPSPETLEYLDRYSVQPEGKERIEIPLTAQSYMARVAARIDRGFIVVIDYGYTRAEQLAGRHRGTVTRIASTPFAPIPMKLRANKTSLHT